MAFRSTYFSLVVICVAVQSARAFVVPTTEATKEPSSEAPVSYDFAAEKHFGRYTGEWVPNTVAHFDRVQAVVEFDPVTSTERLLNFVDELTEAEIKYIENNAFDQTTYTFRSIQYARDHRVETEFLPIGNGPYYYLEVDEVNGTDDETAYRKNKEVIWQIDIPEDHIAFIVLAIALEDPTQGGCINDFVAVYTDDRVPNKFCSTLDEIRQFMPNGSDRLTIKFQSNEANNTGHFSGAVWMYHNSTVVNQQQPSRRDVSLEEEPTAVFEEMKEQLKGYDMDPHPSMVEQAVTCLVRIAKYGKMAAEQYLEHSPNAICKEMAEAFSEKKDPRF